MKVLNSNYVHCGFNAKEHQCYGDEVFVNCYTDKCGIIFYLPCFLAAVQNKIPLEVATCSACLKKHVEDTTDYAQKYQLQDLLTHNTTKNKPTTSTSQCSYTLLTGCQHNNNLHVCTVNDCGIKYHTSCKDQFAKQLLIEASDICYKCAEEYVMI